MIPKFDTLEILATVQFLMMHLAPCETYNRLERIEAYLIRRYNR